MTKELVNEIGLDTKQQKYWALAGDIFRMLVEDVQDKIFVRTSQLKHAPFRIVKACTHLLILIFKVSVY